MFSKLGNQANNSEKEENKSTGCSKSRAVLEMAYIVSMSNNYFDTIDDPVTLICENTNALSNAQFKLTRSLSQKARFCWLMHDVLIQDLQLKWARIEWLMCINQKMTFTAKRACLIETFWQSCKLFVRFIISYCQHEAFYSSINSDHAMQQEMTKPHSIEPQRLLSPQWDLEKGHSEFYFYDRVCGS